MRTRFLRGNTQENNGLTLPEGELSIDEERHALRLHDGVTQGGFELVGTRAVEGPTVGDLSAGFYGEVDGHSEFITYGDLSEAVGVSAGTLQHDAESAWLKFSLDGHPCYVSKKPIRHSISWDALNAAGVVSANQNTRVTIQGQDYIVRLLRGASSDPTVQGSDGSWNGWDIDLSHGSEWNRLFYPIHSGVHTDGNNPSAHTDPHAAAFGSWASYSDDDLVVDYRSGNGSYSWTQEVSGDNASYRVYRGRIGVSHLNRVTSTSSSTRYGWRPALVPVG